MKSISSACLEAISSHSQLLSVLGVSVYSSRDSKAYSGRNCKPSSRSMLVSQWQQHPGQQEQQQRHHNHSDDENKETKNHHMQHRGSRSDRSNGGFYQQDGTVELMATLKYPRSVALASEAVSTRP